MEKGRFEKYYQNKEWFEYSNPNPASADRNTLVWDRGDCAIRAVAHSLDLTWLEAFDKTTSFARSKYSVLNDRGLLRAFFESIGYEWIGLRPVKGKHRITAKEFALSHKKGSYFVMVANHATAIVNGKIQDVWDCGDKAVTGYICTTK